MNPRLSHFDLLRVIATLAVIVIHVSAGYVTASSGAFAMNQVVRFAVPLFLIISGFLLFHTDRMRPTAESLSRYFSKRVTRVLWPYLFWTIIYYLVNGYTQGTLQDITTSLIPVIQHLLAGTANYHLYFMVIIVQFYLLYPGLRWLVIRHPRSCMAAALFLTLFCQSALYLHTIGQIKLPFASSNLYLVAFPIWIFYFILGMYSSLKKEQIQPWLSDKYTALALLWLLALFILGIDGHWTSTYWSSMKPTIILYTTLSYFFFYSLTLKAKNAFTPAIAWFSDQSFLIYLMHPLCLTFLSGLARVLSIPNIWAGFTGMLFLYLMTVSLTLALVYLISMTHLSVYLGGKPRSKAL